MKYFLRKKKWMAWVIMLTFLFTSIMPSNLLAGNSVAEAATGNLTPPTIVYDADGNMVENPPTTLADGQVRLSKTAEPVTGEANTYKVTLEVEGKGVTIPSGGADIVLVLDTSGSMENSIGSMKAAAKTFVDTVLTEGCANRVAIVSFAYTADIDRNLTGYTAPSWMSWRANDTLKDTIESLRAGGGTNTQAGIYQAEQILLNSNASNKMIVLLSDGQPTYNYRTNNITIKDFIWDNDNEATATQDDYNSQKITFNYSSTNVEGAGGSMTYRQKYNWLGERENGKYTLNLNSAYAAIYESGKAKAGSTVYTIGYNTNMTTNGVLTSIASDGKAYTASTADIESIFGQIGQDINQQIKDSAVNDPIPGNVDLDVSSLSNLAAKYEDSKITWSPDISGGKKATLTYTVKLDVEDAAFDPETAYPLNGSTTFTYKLGDGESKIVSFNVPTTPGTYGTVQTVGYLVNSVGEPINAAGEVVSIEKAEKVTQLVDMLNAANKIYFDPASTVALTAPATPTGYTAFDSKARYADGRKITTDIKAGTIAQTFYYPFYKNDQLVITAKDQTYTYDGTPKGVSNGAVMTDPSENLYFVTGLRPGDSVKELIISGSKTDAGTYADELVPSNVRIYHSDVDVTATYHNVSYKPGTLTISQADGMKVSAQNVVKVYDGSFYGVTATADKAGATIKYWNETTNAYDLNESPKIKDVDDSVLTVKFQATHPNYNTVTGEATVTITARPIEITAGSSTNNVYDGTEKKVETSQITSDLKLVGDATYTVTFVNNTRTEAGSQEVTVKDAVVTGDKQSNYSFTYKPGTLTISQADGMKVSAQNVVKVYDGSFYGVTATADKAGATIKYWNETTNAYDLNESPKIKDVDDSVLTVKFQATHPNYNTVTGEATVTITPAPVTITVDNAGKIVGEIDPTFTGKVEGLVDGADLGEITYSRTNSNELVGFYEEVLTATYEVENPNYTVTVIPADFTITQNGEMEYTVEFWYQNPETGEYNIFGGSDTRYTTAGSLVFVTEEDTVTTRSMYQFNAEASTTQGTVAVDAEHPTVLKVMFDALYNVVYNVVDENGNVKRVAAKSGHVYHYNDKVNAPGVVNDELNKFDGKWYKNTAVTDEWLFDADTVAANIALFDLANNTINLYTKADVTPLTGNTLRIEKQTVNAPNAGTDYKFNLKLLAKVDTVTAPVEGTVADELQRLTSAKITAEGKRDAAWGKVLEAERAFKSSTMMTTESALSFIMYGDEVEDINGAVINPALFSLGTTESAYQFQSYNLFENSFAVEAADEASVDGGIVDWMIEIIRNLANPYLRTPFQTLDPKETLMEMQTAGVNTSGSALAFGFNEASDLYLADQDYFTKESAFKAAEAELNDYLAQLGRRAMITINGEQYILDGVDEKGNALYEKDADGNYILNFDFTLKTGMFKDFTVEATTNSAIQFIITETNDGGADSTTVNGVTTHSAYGFLTTGSAITFVNSFKDNGGGGNTGGGEVTPPPEVIIPDPEPPLVEPEEPTVDPTEPTEEITDPDVPLIDVPGEEVEIPEPEVPLGDAPKTGDTNNAVPFVVLMMAAGLGLVITRRRFN